MIDLLVKLIFTFFVSGIIVFPTTDLTSKSDRNAFDTKGNKTGKWYYFGKDIPSMDYPDEILVMEGDYKEGKRNGTWVKYQRDGKTPLFIGNYQNNRPQGAFKRYNSKGFLIESGNFNKGKYDGPVSKYYDNGIPMYEGVFNLGLENGEIKNFDKTGQLELAYQAYNGNVSNEIHRNEIQNNEKIKELNTAAKNKLKESDLAPIIANPIVKNSVFNPNGYNKVYNDKSDILQDGMFKDGRLFDGKIYQYDSDGILFKVKVYKNGIYTSDGQI